MAKRKLTTSNDFLFRNDNINDLIMLNNFQVKHKSFALDIKTLEEIGNFLAKEEFKLPEEPITEPIPPYEGIEEIVDEVISEAILKLPLFLEKADRRNPTEAEIEEFILPELRSYSNELIYQPSLDGKLIKDNHQIAPTLSTVGNTLFATEQGVLIFAASTGK